MTLCPTDLCELNTSPQPPTQQERPLRGAPVSCRTLLVSVWSRDQHHCIIEELVRNAESQSPSDFLNQNLDFTTVLRGLEYILRCKKQLYRTVVLYPAT